MFASSLLKPILIGSSYSSLILLIVAALLCAYSFLLSIRRQKNQLIFISIVLFVAEIILIDYLVRNNGMQMREAYNFIVYGVIPLFLLCGVRNYDALIKYFSIVSILTGLLYLADPFLGYQWSSDYMSFGFSAILPAFCGAVLYCIYFSNRRAWILIFIFFVEMVLFANKSAILCAVIFFLVAYIGFDYSFRIKRRRFFLAISAIAFLVIFRNELLNTFFNLIGDTGISSYSIRTIQILLQGDASIVLDTRLSIWREALAITRENFFLGRGIGYLESIYSNTGYAHNVFLDITSSFGILGGIFFLYVLIKSFFRIRRFNDHGRMVFTVTIFLLWFVPMQFSLTLWRVMYFWIYWGLCYYSTKQPIIYSDDNPALTLLIEKGA